MDLSAIVDTPSKYVPEVCKRAATRWNGAQRDRGCREKTYVDVGVVLVLDVVGVLLVEVVVGTLDDEVNVVLEEVLDEVGVVEVELVVLDVELDVVDVVDVDDC